MLHLATRIPRAIRTATRDWTQNDRVRVEGTTSLIAAAKPAGVRYYVQESVIFIYGDHGDEWITENTPIPHTQPSILRSSVEMERIVEHSALPHVILRSGAFYGSETGTTEMMLESVRHRALPLVGNGRAFMSLIHVEDIARAVTAALTRRLEGTFNIVDTEPVRQEEFLTYAARLLGARSPWRIPSWLARLAGGAGSAVVLRSQRVSSEKARTALGFTFAYPTFREGLAEAARYLLP
jgi:NAD dependent epimerase/dehydratase family enzyme